MPVGLVERAIEESRGREAAVQAMALVYGARVLATADGEAARRAYAEGAAAMESLPLARRQSTLLLHDVVCLGASVDPAAAIVLFRRLQSDEPHPSCHNTGTMLVQSLARRGDWEAALELLEDPRCDTGGGLAIVAWAADPAMQRRAMQAVRERWRAWRKQLREHSGAPGERWVESDFFHLFPMHWRKLDAAEQAGWLDEILQALESDPDRPTRAGFGGRVEMDSTRDAHLFEILGALRALKPAEEVDAILRTHPRVVEAAEIYPLGLESLLMEQRPACDGGGRGEGFLFGGSGRDREMLPHLMAAHQGDADAVEELLGEADRRFREDIDPDDPNLAPRVCWPSCHAYKLAMYWAGRLSGMAGESLLARIPDRDFALLASIELAAGVLGMEAPIGVRMEHHPNRLRRA
jgi:hypothetical protein